MNWLFHSEVWSPRESFVQICALCDVLLAPEFRDHIRKLPTRDVICERVDLAEFSSEVFALFQRRSPNKGWLSIKCSDATSCYLQKSPSCSPHVTLLFARYHVYHPHLRERAGSLPPFYLRVILHGYKSVHGLLRPT